MNLFSDSQKDGDGLDAGPDGGQGGEAALQEVQGGQQEQRQGKRVNKLTRCTNDI